MIFEATETTEIQFYGAIFLLTVKLLFMPFMIWCFCRLYLSEQATTLHLIQFAFDFDKKKMLGKFSRTIPFHLIIDIALCALCDFRRMLHFKYVQKEHSNRRSAHRMIKYRYVFLCINTKWNGRKKTGLTEYWNVSSYAIQMHAWDSISAHDAFLLFSSLSNNKLMPYQVISVSFFTRFSLQTVYYSGYENTTEFNMNRDVKIKCHQNNRYDEIVFYSSATMHFSPCDNITASNSSLCLS